MRRVILGLPLTMATLCVASPAFADALVVSKTATVISDPLGNLLPRSIPGAVVDYKVLFTNPLGNLFKPVKDIVAEDLLPNNVILRVSDLAGAGKGAVDFSDGSLLGTGLLGSGLSYSYISLSSSSDGLEFWNGTSWSYTPVPDANGYDSAVRGIRVKPTTNFTTGGSFQIRFRVKIR